MTANIMSLGGIAVAIGAMVDAAIVVVEQTHKKLEHWQAEGRPGDYHSVVISAVKEVGGPKLLRLAGDRRCASCRCSPWKRKKAGCSSRWRTPRISP